MPGPIDCPDRLVPPPRAVSGALRNDDAERLDLVDAGVGAIKATRNVVEADLAGEMLSQVTGQGVAPGSGEIGHGGLADPNRGTVILARNSPPESRKLSERMSRTCPGARL
jgi:hypothetical protein